MTDPTLQDPQIATTGSTDSQKPSQQGSRSLTPDERELITSALSAQESGLRQSLDDSSLNDITRTAITTHADRINRLITEIEQSQRISIIAS